MCHRRRQCGIQHEEVSLCMQETPPPFGGTAHFWSSCNVLEFSGLQLYLFAESRTAEVYFELKNETDGEGVRQRECTQFMCMYSYSSAGFGGLDGLPCRLPSLDAYWKWETAGTLAQRCSSQMVNRTGWLDKQIPFCFLWLPRTTSQPTLETPPFMKVCSDKWLFIYRRRLGSNECPRVYSRTSQRSHQPLIPEG